MVHQELRHTVNRSYPALIAVMFMVTPALAEEPKSSAITPHQMAHCMMQRMHEDRTESYREAFKLCREDLAAAESPRTAATAMNARNESPTSKQ